MSASSHLTPKRPGESSARAGLARHLDGWQPGLLAVFLAGTAAVLAVPRPVDPLELPEPRLELDALERTARADADLAEAVAARRAPLDFDLRALGSTLRAYGVADAAAREDEIAVRLRAVAEAGQRAAAAGDEALVMLRAFQLRSFLRELHRWEATSVETDELREVGGGFIGAALRNGWVEEGRLRMDHHVRRALFKKRWNELTGVRSPRLDLTLDETRAFYRFLLLYPPRLEGTDAPRHGASDLLMRRRPPTPDERAAFAVEKYRLRKIQELAAVDPSYPADLARGVALYRLRSYGQATEMFRRHLAAHPDGPYTLRVQNFLHAALTHAAEQL